MTVMTIHDEKYANKVLETIAPGQLWLCTIPSPDRNNLGQVVQYEFLAHVIKVVDNNPGPSPRNPGYGPRYVGVRALQSVQHMCKESRICNIYFRYHDIVQGYWQQLD